VVIFFFFDADINVVTVKELAEGIDDIDSGVKSPEKDLKKIRLLLGTLAKLLHEESQYKDIKKNFDIKPLSKDPDISNQIKAFLMKYVQVDCKLMRLLKLLHHIVLAPPYLILKKKFSEAGFAIKDFAGFWSVQLVFKNNEVHIIHEKKSLSGSQFAEEQFEFVWDLQIVTDKDILQIRESKLMMSELEINPNVSEEKKKLIRSVMSKFIFK